MNKLLSEVASKVKGQFVTVPLEDPSLTTNLPGSAASDTVDSTEGQAKSPKSSSSDKADSSVPTTKADQLGASETNNDSIASSVTDLKTTAVNMFARVSTIFGQGKSGGSSTKENISLLGKDLESGISTGVNEQQNEANAEQQTLLQGNFLTRWFKTENSAADANGSTDKSSSDSVASSTNQQSTNTSWINPLAMMQSREPNMWDKICPEISRKNRLTGFFILGGLSAIFFLLSFFIGLPMVFLVPSKFALSFTVASILFMFAFAVLEGPATYFTNMCTRDRLPFALAYFGSLLATLYVSFFGALMITFW